MIGGNNANHHMPRGGCACARLARTLSASLQPKRDSHRKDLSFEIESAAVLARRLAEQRALSGAIKATLHYREGATIYREGEPAPCGYEVRKGVVRACRYLPSGDRHITSFFYPGDVFGLDIAHRDETVEAVTNVEVVRILRAEVSKYPADDNPIMQAVVRNMKVCIRMLAHRSAEERVAAFLLVLSSRLGGGQVIPLPMSRTDIADFLRLTMHTVSRTISQLCSRQVIAMSGPQAFRIVNMRALRQTAEEEAECPNPRFLDDYGLEERRYAAER
ncbi:MAG: helix-turn-helix domain-containing protein [Novosphingobium sp.]